jgi:phosphoribosylformylglycinamidine cyclo-ligase
MLALAQAVPVRGFAHITGGGLTDNIPRVIPDGLEVVLERGAWRRDPVFEWLQQSGRIADDEMHRTFNCGIGMVAVVAPEHEAAALALLQERGEQATRIGTVREGTQGVLFR